MATVDTQSFYKGSPSAGDGTLTIKRNGTVLGTFTAKQSWDTDVDITVPVRTSQLDNDSGFVSDQDYVHTDNNFTDELHSKLEGVESGAQVNVQADWNQTDTSAQDYIKNKPLSRLLPETTSSDGGKILTVNNTGTGTEWRSTDDLKAFKGWFDSSSALSVAYPSPKVGDYAYIKGASASDPTAIYECTTAGTWSDSERTVDTSSVQTFASGEEVNDVHIIDDLTTSGEHDVLSAKQGKIIRETTMELVYGLNILAQATIKIGKRVNTSGVEADVSNQSVYGCTDYIEITEEGLIANHCALGSGSTFRGAILFSEIGTVYSTAFLNPSTIGGSLSINPSDYPGLKYVRFNLYGASNEPNDYAVYRQLSLPASDPEPYVQPHWEQKKQSIEDGEVTTGKIADKAITIGKIHDTEYKYLSRNLCNPEDCVFDKHYINGSTGKVSASTSTSSGGYTGFIPIDTRGLYFYLSNLSGTYIGYAYYSDADENSYIDGAYGSYRPDANCTSLYAAYINGAKYVRFTFKSSATADNIMISAGRENMPYEPYAGKVEVISRDILPDMGEDSKTYIDGVEVQLPNEIVVTKGDNLQVFYRSCVKCRNVEAFDVTAECKKGSSYYGMPHHRYFQLDTSSSAITANSTFTLTVKVKDNAHRVIASGSTTIKVINTMQSPGSVKNVLMLGASTLADGKITKELYRRLCTVTGSGTFYDPTGIGLSNIAFVGSERASVEYQNAYQEAHSGKGWNWYADQGSDTNIYRFFCPSTVDLSNASEGDIYKQGNLTFELTNDISTQDNVFTAIVTGTGTVIATNGTLTKQSGSGPDTITYDTASAEGGNPFWYGGKLDFQHYADDAANHCNGNIDLIVACLAGNDITQVAEGFEYCKETYIKPFLNAFHADFPNAKVLIYTPPLLRYNGVATKPEACYWNRVVQFWKYAKGYEELLNEEYEDGHTYSEFVSISSTTYEFDNENLYGGSNIPICNRSQVTEKFSADNLHYTADGCNTVADTLFHCINNISL